MPRDSEELYGVEHLANIIDGDWELFKSRFENRKRTDVYLGEIAELRHNLAHRCKRHLVRRDDLVRFTQNAQRLLQAIGASEADRFGEIVYSLTQGGRPWTTQAGGQLPPHDEIYDEFVGRPGHLRELADWFTSDSKQAIVWGYGGAGKSALAFKFAREVQEAPPAGIDAVVWVTAKRSEFVEGKAKDRTPDFVDIEGFCERVWSALYAQTSKDREPQQLIAELIATKCLLVVDDLDTVIHNEEMAQFLLLSSETQTVKSCTSRQQVPGIKRLEVSGFEGEELRAFMELRAREYAVETRECLRRLAAILEVTDGYPLFVDDLIRYSMLVGVEKAITDWGQRKGDGAREYALRRQLEHLKGMAADVLMSVAVSDRPLRLVEIGQVAGITDADAEQGTEDLLGCRLLHTSISNEDSTPVFVMNANTRNLTLNTFKESMKLKEKETALLALTGERVPAAKRQAIATAIVEAKRVLHTGGS